MKKKASKKTKAKASIPEQKPDSKTVQAQDNESNFDFGGLPDRDLKKNLGGCG